MHFCCNLRIWHVLRCYILYISLRLKFLSFQFMVRSEVLKLYRSILRTVRRIPDEYYRGEMTNWARRDFKSNKHLTDEVIQTNR